MNVSVPTEMEDERVTFDLCDMSKVQNSSRVVAVRNTRPTGETQADVGWCRSARCCGAGKGVQTAVFPQDQQPVLLRGRR